MVPVLAATAVYVLAMLLLAPRFIERELKESVAKEPGMTLEMSAVAVNPFTLALSATNIKLIGPENTLVVSVGSMQARVHALSPLRGSWIVRRLVLDGLRADLQVADAGARGALKVASGLLRAAAGNPAQKLDIRHLALRRGEVRLQSAADAATPRAGLVLSEVELETRDSAAETAGRPIRMTAAINDTALVEASGRFESSRDTLTVRLTALVDNASVFAPYVSLAPDLQWRAGELRGDVALVYRNESSRVEANLALQELNVTDADSGELLTCRQPRCR
ncbi:MAG: DUF748 domain-containing protein [Woeseiaceae bacterium]|nr:DUF748 domain-containing protein [Woeseiaceae bacterium]